MKLFLKLCFCILTVVQFTKVYAAEPGIYCLDNGTGEWLRLGSGATMDRPVNIGARQYPSGGTQNGTHRVFSLGTIFLQCRNSMEDNATYDLRIYEVFRPNNTMSPGFINPNDNYISYAYTNNSSFRPTNFATVRMPPRNSLGTLALQPSLIIYATNTVVPAGTYLGTLQFIYNRNGVAQNNSTINIRLYSQADEIFQPETCIVNNGQPLEVDLGTIAEVEIPASSGLNSNITRTIDLQYSCDQDVNSRMRVQLVGQPSTFSTTAVETRSGNVYGAGETIQHLGIEFYKDTIVLAPNSVNGFMTEITNGVGSDTLTIAPVKSAQANSVNLPSGYFNATATLVFTTP